VALGTDSLASNPDLDVRAEVRSIHAQHPEVPGAALLTMATLAGAQALGWGDTTGSLDVGKSADLLVLGFADDDPYGALWGNDEIPRQRMYRGQFDRSQPLTRLGDSEQ
jgi:cytosine/adenosine deaminase-related metal-dependent hydrolase